MPAICHRSPMSSMPLDVVDLDARRRRAIRSAGSRIAGSMPAPTSSRDDLAEAPAPELVLDRLEQVVGLVGDLEVGVARDPEQVVADDLHAREQRVEVLGDDVLERDERVLARSRRTAAGPPWAP